MEHVYLDYHSRVMTSSKDSIEELRDPRTGELASTSERYRSGPSARMVDYDEYDREAQLTFPHCGWTGLTKDADHEDYRELFDVSCPKCTQMLLIVGWPDAPASSDPASS